MTAILSCLRSVPIYPAGADKPLAIHRPTKEIVDAAREAVIADQEATKVLRETAIETEGESSFNTGVSTAVDAQSLNVQPVDVRRPSNASIRSVNHRHNVGLRRAGQAPDGLQ
jgi:DNA segregation ATPase FtsK/SpoIIIE-like protein